MKLTDFDGNKRKSLYGPASKAMGQSTMNCTHGIVCTYIHYGNKIHHGHGVHHMYGVHHGYGVHQGKGVQRGYVVNHLYCSSGVSIAPLDKTLLNKEKEKKVTYRPVSSTPVKTFFFATDRQSLVRLPCVNRPLDAYLVDGGAKAVENLRHLLELSVQTFHVPAGGAERVVDRRQLLDEDALEPGGDVILGNSKIILKY